MVKFLINMKTVIICGYFVNNKYNKEILFNDWLNNVRQYYFIDCQQIIIVYTDNSELLKYNSTNCIINVIQNDDFSNIGENRLKKMKYLNILCNNYVTNNISYISFFQSNLRLNTQIISDECLNKYKLAAALHPEFFSTKDFRKYYHNSYARGQNNKKSITDITNLDTSQYTYYQNGHLVGDAQIVKLIISHIYNLINIDKSNNIKIIGQPFDERYFNYYLNVINPYIKINKLNPLIYNNRGKYYPLTKIYQINKMTSQLFSN